MKVLMSDDMISQEEIDALLNGGSIPTADSAPAGESETAAAPAAASPDSSSSQLDDVLTDMEKDALWKELV